MTGYTKHIYAVIALAAVAALGAVAAEPESPAARTKTFSVSKGGTLEVSVNSGDIRISTWDRNEVAVRAQPSEDDEDNIKITQNGSIIRVTDRGSWGEDDTYEISVPVKFNLDLRTSSGDLTVVGKLEGTFKGTTYGGSITTADVTGRIDVSTSGGDIQTGRINGDGRLMTSGGDISVDGTSGELEVNTSGGEIRLGNIGKSLRAYTSGGDVEIGSVGGNADVSTSGGDVLVGKVDGRAQLKTSGGNVELRGGSGDIYASTSGGDIRLSGIAGSVEAKTSGGDVYAELVPSGKGPSKLSSAAGKITLLVPENARATIDARIRLQSSWRYTRENYNIYSDFKAESGTSNDDSREKRATYVLNGGGQSITLTTVNSDIQIRKLRK